MDTAQWPQEIVVKPMEEIVGTSSGSNNNSSSSSKPSSSSCGERKIRPQKEQAVNCPRCNSTNTKFCYYNNYSLTQPRYFCKTCRRYWTEGGSLRNIPVGGGSRKNKRSSSSVSSVSVSVSVSSANNNGGLAVKKLPDLVPPVPPILHHHHHHHLHQQQQQNPSKIHENHHHHQDLNLGFSQHQDFKTISELIQVPNYESKDGGNDPHRPSSSSPPSTATHHHLSALELLTGMTTAATSSRGLMSSFIPMPPIPDPNNYSSFPLPEFKPSLNFSLDGIGNNNGAYGNHHHLQGMQETATASGGGGRLFFPFEDLKSTAAPDGGEQERDNNNPAGESTGGHGFWNGVLGAGGGSCFLL